jgi:hypothetical protein
MKIEISEVLVTRTDAITLDLKPTAVGIAALEPRSTPIPPNIKYHRVPLITALYRLVPLCTTKMKRMFHAQHHERLHVTF